MPHWQNQNPAPEQLETLKRIRALVLDVDGVLTDGGIIYGSEGLEIKRFDCKDGLGLRLFKKAGLEVAIITGRQSEAVAQRAKDLEISYLYQKCGDKKEVIRRFSKESGIPLENMAAMGDDIIDLPMFRQCGLPIAVADAARETVRAAQLVTLCNGGRGAVREICEYILKAQGLWDELIKEYYA